MRLYDIPTRSCEENCCAQYHWAWWVFWVFESGSNWTEKGFRNNKKKHKNKKSKCSLYKVLLCSEQSFAQAETWIKLILIPTKKPTKKKTIHKVLGIFLWKDKRKSIRTISYPFSRWSPTSSYKCITLLTHAACEHVCRGCFCFQPQRKNSAFFSAPVVTLCCAALHRLSSARTRRPIKRTHAARCAGVSDQLGRQTAGQLLLKGMHIRQISWYRCVCVGMVVVVGGRTSDGCSSQLRVKKDTEEHFTHVDT